MNKIRIKRELAFNIDNYDSRIITKERIKYIPLCMSDEGNYTEYCLSMRRCHEHLRDELRHDQ